MFFTNSANRTIICIVLALLDLHKVLIIRERPPMIELFDTHAHLCREFFDAVNEPDFASEMFERFPPQVHTYKDFNKSHDFRMAGILNVAVSLASSFEVIKYAEKCNQLYPAVGIHPNCVNDLTRDSWKKILELSKREEVAAIGETGLDRYRDTVPFEIQLQYFELHLELAKVRNLPVIIHSRDCDDDMLAVLDNLAKMSPVFGVIHSFSGTPKIAEKLLDMGLYISFSGAVTYKNKKFRELREAAKIVPDDRLLIETDCPYLTPHPYRGKLDNNVPLMTAYTAKTLAELRNTTIGEIAVVTTANALKIFQKKRKK